MCIAYPRFQSGRRHLKRFKGMCVIYSPFLDNLCVNSPLVRDIVKGNMWEGIGVSSYLLINFWFTRIQANKSAIKAMVVNRVGDMFLSVAFFGVFWTFGNLDYATVYSLSPYMNETVLTIIGLLFLLAAMGKSAQLGLHTWLPDAMEGKLLSTLTHHYTS